MSISAMKQALDALDVFSEHGGNRFTRAADVLRQAIAEAEKQEPVAWLSKYTNDDNKTIGYTLWKKDVGEGCFPVYASPPKREWVGLTDEDKQIAFDDTQEGGGFWEFADAIEAKLKEKNT